MAESAELARPYAAAAFRQAQDEGTFSEWTEMLELLSAFVRDPTMSALIANPKMGHARLVEFFIEVCGDLLSDTGRNFVRVIGYYRRFALLPEISRRFADECAAREGRNVVLVATRFALSEPQRTIITAAMEKRLGTKVTLDCTVDDALIGGVVIRFGDRVIDASLKGRLHQLAQALA